MIKKTVKKILLVFGGILLVSVSILLSRNNVSASNNGSEEICVKHNGNMYLIGSNYQRSNCRGNDTIVQIDHGGLTGPQGPQGPVGPQGPIGPQGAVGPVGPQGPIGPQGAFGPQGIQGEKGDTGEAGIQGPQGPVGPQGPIGPQGAQGIQGEKGDTGTSVVILGSYNSEAELIQAHPIGNPGNSYLVTGNLYVWDGSVWQNVGNIQGPQGAQGVQGEQGPQGAQGDVGPIGPVGPAGSVGPIGPVGPAGSVGPIGPVGPQGPTGLKGDTGEAGVIGGVTRVMGTPVTITDPVFNTQITATASCGNKLLISGGAMIDTTGEKRGVHLHASYPSEDATSWIAAGTVYFGAPQSVTVTAYALCAN